MPGSGRSPGGEYGNPLQYDYFNKKDKSSNTAAKRGSERTGQILFLVKSFKE